MCIFAASAPTKPLNEAQMRGAFLYIYIRLPQKFSEVIKHYISFNLFNYRLLYSFIN